MKQPRTIIFKFDVDNPLHLKAMQYLDISGRKRFATAGDAIATALVKYFENLELEDDELPEGEASGDGHDIGEIVKHAVERELDKALPVYLAKYMKEVKVVPSGGSDKETEDSEGSSPDVNELKDLDEDIDWGFLGG